MPICRHQIRGEFGLADPELYRAADRDDPEAVLEGVAMAGLVGVLRQLGDLAEFAAEIFHDLHEEVMATAARGHGLMLRVQQLEEEFPSMEKSFLAHTSLLQNASMAGFEWHSNLRLEQSLVASGDLPRFIMDSYEECRGPPRLFLLDKFDVAGAGACLKRYSDPSFFKTEFSSSGHMKADVPKERKIRKLKRKGMHYKGGDGPDFFTSSKFSSMLQDGRFNEPSNFSGKNTFHVVKLKRRNFIDSSFNSRNKKLYMEQIFKVPSPELKPVYENSLVYSSLDSASIDNNEAHDEIHEISLMDPAIKETPMERNGRNTRPTSIDYSHELVRGHSLSKSDNDFKMVEKVTTLPEARPKDVIVDGYNSDSNTSGVDNFMDALATMDSELEASLQNRLKSEKSLLSIPSQGLDSESNDEQAELQDHLSDSYSAESSSVSYEWKEALKKKGSSHSTSDTPSSVDELLSSNENSSRVNFASDNPSSPPVDARHDKLISAVQVPNEASSRFFNTDSAPDHPEHILVSPQVLSASDEDHTSDLSSNAGKVNGHMVAGSKNLSVSSRCIFNAAENAQTLDSVGRRDTNKYSSLEDNSSDNQNASKCYETSVNAILVGDPSRSEIVENKLIENIQPMVEEKPNLLMDRDASHKESISLSLPQSDNVGSHGLNILEMKNVSQFTKSEQSMNNENEKESTSVDKLEDVSEPEVPTFISKTPKDEDSPQVLTDESEHIHFHEISGDQLIFDNSEVFDENDTLKFYSVPDISISVMNEEPKVINSINLHDRVDTDKCEYGREVLSGLSSSEEHQQLDKVGVICSIRMVSTGGNDSCREYTSEGISGQQKPETIELLSLDPSSSYLNEVDPVTTGFSDEVVNESKVDEIAPSVMKNYERDAPVVDLPLSGSTQMMHDSLILNSSSGSVNLSYQLATESHLYSLNTLEAPTPLTETDKDAEFPPPTTDASDTVHDSAIGNETRFISSTKPKMDPEVDVTSPTSLLVLPDVLSELESGKGNSECPQETRLEYSCEDSGKVELPECTVETPKAGPSNHVAEEPSDNISSKQSAEGMFQASDVHPEHPIDVEDACQQNHELPNGRNLKCSANVEIPQMLNENYQTSGSHSSHMSSYVYLEHTEGLDQTLERQISDEISQKKVGDAIALKYSFQEMKQTSKDANSSVLQARIFNQGTQTVQQQSEGVPVEFVESLTEKVPVRLHQHTLEDLYEGLNPNSRVHLDVPSTPLLRESEARVAFPSLHNTQASIPAMTSSGVMFPSFDSSGVKSATPISSDQDTMPPLPPLPPLQWRSGKLQQGSSNFLLDEGSSTLSSTPPLDASEDSRPLDFHASADTNSLLTNPVIDELITRGADNSEPMIMSSKSLLPVTESWNVEYSHAINPFASLGHEEPQHGPNQIGEQYVPEVSPKHAGTDEEPHHNLVTPGGKQNAPEVSPKQTGADEEPDPNEVTSERDVEPSVNSFAPIWIEENERPASRMVLPRRKDPLIEAVAAHDRSKLRKVSDRVRSEIKPTTDDRNSLLEQIRTKSFNLKPAATTRPNIQGPKTNLNVVAILEKANAIRQALAGSDDENDDADNWSDS